MYGSRKERLLRKMGLESLRSDIKRSLRQPASCQQRRGVGTENNYLRNSINQWINFIVFLKFKLTTSQLVKRKVIPNWCSTTQLIPCQLAYIDHIGPILPCGARIKPMRVHTTAHGNAGRVGWTYTVRIWGGEMHGLPPKVTCRGYEKWNHERFTSMAVTQRRLA